MGIVELLLIGMGLSMDAFAVAVCKGLDMQKINKKHCLLIGLFFGGFQASMPLLGWILGSRFQQYIKEVDHWIAFILLVIIGGKMILEAFGEMEKEESRDSILDIKELLMLSVATSIDALAVGITFAFLQVRILPAIGMIGTITFLLSIVGVLVGHIFGSQYKNRADLVGGMILIAIGVKILLEHLGILSI